jgi:hypothetical protein
LNLIHAASAPGTASSLATAPPDTFQLQAPAADIWHMYNAIEKDEGDLRIIFIALPALITLALVLTPFILRMLVASQVETAVEERVAEAKQALVKAEAEYRARSKEFALRIEEVRALLHVRLAYLHWNLEDRDLAVFYARSASHTARTALIQEPENERLRHFQQDADDSLAYYVAELSELEHRSVELVEIAKNRGLEMLNQLSAKSQDPDLDIETVDTCLFVMWSFRDRIAATNLSRSAALYRDWAIALNSHQWKNASVTITKNTRISRNI